MSQDSRNSGKALLVRAKTKAEKQRWERVAQIERRTLTQIVRAMLNERWEQHTKAVGQ